MKKMLIPGYTVGVDAYGDIENVCPVYGKNIVVIGGANALNAAQEAILRAADEAQLEVIGVYCTDAVDPQMLSQADMLFAVGGGRAIDAGKALAYENRLPIFTFPTVASACAACTGSFGSPQDGEPIAGEPPVHIFINTQIIADAPGRYLRAGMGNALAMYYTHTAGASFPDHGEEMGIALSTMCAAPILRSGQTAMLDCMAHQVSDALTEVVLANIISAGYVTNLRARKSAAALAQAVCSGFDANTRYLRGEVLAYGILIMLTMEKRYQQRDELYAFSRSVGLPACLADLQADEAMLPAIAKRILSAMDDVSCTEAMLIDAILEAEEYDRQQKETEEPIEE